MPTLLTLALQAERPDIAPHEHANGLRALLLGWLREADAALASALHDADQPKPYSIGPLLHRGDARYECRIGLLDDRLLAVLSAGVRQRGAALRLGGDYLRLLADGVRIEQQRWETLLHQDAPPALGWHLFLDTPTAHHQTGMAVRKALVSPLPDTYIAGWARRWQQFSPLPLPDTLLPLVAERLTVSSLRGETRRVFLDRGRVFIGYIGEVTFHLCAPRAEYPAERQALTALARLAPYCGTGVDTARGMGQTRYLLGD